MVLRDEGDRGHLVDPLCTLYVSTFNFDEHALTLNTLAVVIFLWILITLTTRAQAMGRQYAWSEPIFELPWFGQYPGMPANMYGQGAGNAWNAVAGRVCVPWLSITWPVHTWPDAADGAANG